MSTNKRREYLAEAKQRMKSGYWQEVVIRRNGEVSAAIKNGDSPDRVIESYKQRLYRTFRSTELPYPDEEKLFEKVKQMRQCEFVANPLGLLADKRIIGTLDEAGRERYILELAGVYRRLMSRLDEGND